MTSPENGLIVNDRISGFKMIGWFFLLAGGFKRGPLSTAFPFK